MKSVTHGWGISCSKQPYQGSLGKIEADRYFSAHGIGDARVKVDN
jgi:hypothetical protein